MYIRAVFFFPLVLFGLLTAGALGSFTRRRFPGAAAQEHAGLFAAVQALLGLFLGFSFSMGAGRYGNGKSAVSASASFLVGLGVLRWHGLVLTILPLVVAASLTLIWDLENQRRGFVRMRQDSMHRTSAALQEATP